MWLMDPQGTRHDASGSSFDWIPGCPPQLSQPFSCCFRAVGSQLPRTFLSRALWEQLEEDKGAGEYPPLLLPHGVTWALSSDQPSSPRHLSLFLSPGPSPFRKWELGAQVAWA